MPPCRFLTKKSYSVPHQSSQFTEDTEVGGEKRKGRGRENSEGKEGKMFEVTQKAKGRSRKLTGYCTEGERDMEEGEDRHFQPKVLHKRKGRWERVQVT